MRSVCACVCQRVVGKTFPTACTELHIHWTYAIQFGKQTKKKSSTILFCKWLTFRGFLCAPCGTTSFIFKEYNLLATGRIAISFFSLSTSLVVSLEFHSTVSLLLTVKWSHDVLICAKTLPFISTRCYRFPSHSFVSCDGFMRFHYMFILFFSVSVIRSVSYWVFAFTQACTFHGF